MSEEIIEASFRVEPHKRGRGRPKGSLNKKTLAKQEAMHQAHTSSLEASPQNVSYEEEPEPEPTQDQPEPEPESEPELSAPRNQRKPRKPKLPEMAPEEEEEEEASFGASPQEEPQPPPPSPKKKKPRAPKPVRMEPEPPLTYLQVLQRGLMAARASHKAEKIRRYDAYFSHL